MNNRKLLPTTVVGSYPKPNWLRRLIREYEKGEISNKIMRRAYDDAVKAVVKEQELAGVDILWDGEMRRDEMISYFARRIEGFTIYGEVRVWGNNYYPKPAIIDELRYRDELAVSDYKFLRRITDHEIKIPITGPYTLVDWSFNEYYRTHEEAVYALAEVINQELRRLADAGASYIQIDDPAIPTHPRISWNQVNQYPGWVCLRIRIVNRGGGLLSGRKIQNKRIVKSSEEVLPACTDGI